MTCSLARRRTPVPDRPLRRLAVLAPAALAGALLLLVAAAARSGTPLSATTRPVGAVRFRNGLRLPSNRYSGRAGNLDLPGAGSLLWVAVLGGLVLLALLGFALLLALRGFLGRPTGIGRRPRTAVAGPDAADATADELARRLRGEVSAALEELEETGDPRRAVIACWLRLERAVADAGTPRRAAETPAELVTRVLAAHRVRPARLERLVALYREARYSRHELDDGVRRSARAALEDVRRDLTSVPA